MSLQWALSREIPADIAAVGRAILPEGNAYRQIGDRFQALFPEESEFADLYQPSGRGALPPLLMALVTVFQMLEKVPDREVAEWVRSRLDWKYALHLPLLFGGFNFTDLHAFRQRLLAHGRERQVFDLLLTQLQQAHLLKPRGKMRTDSTHVLAVIERLSQLELVTESLRVALQALIDLVPDWVAETLPAAFCDAYELRQSQYGLSEVAIQRKLSQAGQDGFWFLARVDESAPAVVRRLPEVQVLRPVLAQQFPTGPGQPPARKRPAGRAVIESPHEPEARYGRKRGQGWSGYKVQVTETCDDDQPHLIVDLEPSSALDNDGPELRHIQARLQQQRTSPGEQWVDQGYMSGQNLVDSCRAGISLIGTPLADTSGPPGFRQADFQIDEAAHQVTCPAGQTSTVWSDSRGGSGGTRIRFAAETCQHCQFWGQCTRSGQGRSLTLHPHRAILTAQRDLAQTEAFKNKLHLRAGIEATISELVRAYDLRHARYRGLRKLRLQAYFAAVAINLKRSVRWWTQPKRAELSAAAT